MKLGKPNVTSILQSAAVNSPLLEVSYSKIKSQISHSVAWGELKWKEEEKAAEGK